MRLGGEPELLFVYSHFPTVDAAGLLAKFTPLVFAEPTLLLTE